MLKGGKSGPAIVLGKPEDSLVIKKNPGWRDATQAKADCGWCKADHPRRNAKDREVDCAGRAGSFAGSNVCRHRERSAGAPKGPSVLGLSDAAPSGTAQGSTHGPRTQCRSMHFSSPNWKQSKLSFSPEADRSTLIRRASFDLTGMPPEPAEVKAFLADKDPGAYEKLIDKLLASPRYGERWGRYWLDLAGYADSEGGKLSADLPRPYAFRYRDYVIRAFNADKPYNRFLTEQIAGDELVDYEKAPVITQEIMDNLIATGFLRMAPDSTTEREVNFVDDRIDVIADEIETVTSSVMGITLKCARCHDHKYDPLPQRDYYRFKAIFQGAYDEHDWVAPLTLEKYGLYFPGRYLPYVTPGATPVQLLEEQRHRELVNKEIAIQDQGSEGRVREEDRRAEKEAHRTTLSSAAKGSTGRPEKLGRHAASEAG